MNIFASLDPSVKKLLGWKMGDEEEKWALKAVESLVKKLRKRRSATFHGANSHLAGGGGSGNGGGCGSVEDLEYALAHPGSHSKCVTIPRSLDGRLQVSHRKGLPHVIYCRVWRWPNLQSHHELKPTSDCIYPYDNRSEYICINPYHYQRIETSPGPNMAINTNVQPNQQQLQQQRRMSPEGSLYSNSQQLINGNLMGFPPCSSASSSSSSRYSPFQQIPPNSNCPHPVQRQNIMPIVQYNNNNTNNNNLPPNLSRGPAPNGNFFFGNGMNLNCAPMSAGSSNSSASSVVSAQSPSALSDDDDFGVMAAVAAAATAAGTAGGCATGGGGLRYSGNFMGESGANSVTNANGAADQFPDYWCSICYYELNSRVGELFKVSSERVTVDGFTDPSNDEERICLGLLSNVNRNNTIECTRRHIGKGVRFMCTETSVAVLNLSESPVFVQSRNSNFKYNLQSTAVCRVPSNASIVIFDFPLFHNMLEKARAEGYNHVYDLQKMCFIRMSFVKGWGVDYHRQDVTSTPCWIEIQLHRPLAWIDTVLAPMNPPDHLNITSVS